MKVVSCVFFLGHRKGCGFLLPYLLAFLAIGAGAMDAPVLPSSRRIQWTPGVRGGIPNRTSLINVKQIPYLAKGNGRADDQAAIQNAIDSASPGQVVYLPASTYRISGTLSLSKGITLRGDGPSRTIIKYDGSSSIDIIKAYPWLSGFDAPIPIVSGFAKGSTRLTLSEASDIARGSIIVISQKNPSWVTADGNNGLCSWCGHNDPSRSMTQVARVTGKIGNTLTIERALYYPLDPGMDPTVQGSTFVSGIGIEDLQVWRSNSAATSGFNLSLGTVANSWIKNVVSINAGEAHILIENAYACEVRECYLQDGFDHGPGHSYGIFLTGLNSEHLIENNVVYRCRHSLVIQAGGSGCVFGYNYAVGAVSDPDQDWLTGDMDAHGANPYMNLFEGNVVAKLALDNTWGSSCFNTTYRCWIVNYSSQNKAPTNGRWAADVQQHSYYENLLGNIIGRPGDQGVRYAGNDTSKSDRASYRLGFASAGSDQITDPMVQSTIYIHGNYDYIGGSTLWDSSNPDHNLPDSLYLSSKPSWWGNLRWPAFGPDLNPMIGKIPAQLRYEELATGQQDPGVQYHKR
jgi:hypothetical protein